LGAEFLYTYRRYEVYEFNAAFPFRATDDPGLQLEFSTAYRSRTSDRFFGIGNDSPLSNESAVRTITRQVSAGLSTPIAEDWRLGSHLLYRNFGVTEPRGVPSSQQVFRDAGVPGLLSGAEIGSLRFLVDRDTRDRLYVPTQGSLQNFEVSFNEGLGKGDFSYWKYRIESQNFFPLSSTHRQVVTLRALAETNQERGNGVVPFVDLAQVGSWDSLRGVSNQRFYDNSAVAASLEYRYGIWRALDAALFVDAGQVGKELGDLALGDFHAGYGGRVIVWATETLPISFDVARSREAWRFYIHLRPRF
jgi:outer membrane protein assembly factor BamA